MKRNRAGSGSDVLEGAPLRYAPTNELGVVFLFAHLAKKYRLRVDTIQSAFPDCVAFRKTQRGEKRLRIEFEYQSRSFRTHGHDAGKCDCIVCWEHNWPEAPRRLEIIELRREFGLGFNVWIMPSHSPYKEWWELKTSNRSEWSVPSQSHKGDLILFYSTAPEKYIGHLFVMKEHAGKGPADWKPGKDYFARVTRVCRLKAPLHFEEMQRDKILSTAGFIRGSMRGRPNVTEYWPHLYDLIVRRNPSVKRLLRKYAPWQI